MSPTPPTYREVLHVPWYWWLLGAGFAFSLLLAGLRFFHPLACLAIGVLAMVPIALGLLSYGGVVVRVDATGLHVGRGVVEWRWVAGAAALDDAATVDRMGPGADARAWLCVRPYLSRTVEVELADPADPHPYWLIGSRHPERLAAAIGAHLASGGGDGDAADAGRRRRVDPADPTGVAAKE